MLDRDYGVAFQLIAAAGDSKSDSMHAIRAAREGNFEKAEQFLKSADEKMNQAHEIQFDMIQQESSGNLVAVNIILVHAQDHLAMAMVVKDMAEEITELYKKFTEQKG